MKLQVFIDEFEKNPIYQAAKTELSGNKIDADLQSRILSYIFSQEKIDIQLDTLLNMTLPSGFHRNLQSRINELDEKQLNKQLFAAIIKIKKENTKFDIYELFGMKLENLYAATQKDLHTAYTFATFIKKIKASIFDKNALPYPYMMESHKDNVEKIQQDINLHLLSGIYHLFKYSSLNGRNTLLDAIIPDIKYLFTIQKHTNNEVYLDQLSKMVYSMHPNIFGYLSENNKIEMPRKHKIAYLEHNLATMDNKQFSYFASSFRSKFIDSDIVIAIAGEKAQNKTAKFMDNFKNIQNQKPKMFP